MEATSPESKSGETLSAAASICTWIEMVSSGTVAVRVGFATDTAPPSGDRSTGASPGRMYSRSRYGWSASADDPISEKAVVSLVVRRHPRFTTVPAMMSCTCERTSTRTSVPAATAPTVAEALDTVWNSFADHTPVTDLRAWKRKSAPGA